MGVMREARPDPLAARLRVRRCRAWDFAASEAATADYTVGARLAVLDERGTCYIEDVIRGRWGPNASRSTLFPVLT